jgi:carboxymethylenebutenolidase
MKETEIPMAGEMITWSAHGEDIPGYLSAPDETPAPGIVVLQEWWGLEPHIQDVADRFATEGFVALAPDLYRGVVVDEPDEARKMAMELEHDKAISEIDSAMRYLLGRQDVRGDTVGVIGFCMGGGLSLKVACKSAAAGAAVVFYGRNPDPIDIVRDLKCPLLGIYGEADSGIPPSEVERLRDALASAGKKDFHLQIYPDAPHAFFNDRRASYREEASKDAWETTLVFLREQLG